jgi:hypothetical protein
MGLFNWSCLQVKDREGHDAVIHFDVTPFAKKKTGG